MKKEYTYRNIAKANLNFVIAVYVYMIKQQRYFWGFLVNDILTIKLSISASNLV